MGLDIWRRQMIEPLKDELVRLLLDGIRYDRLGSGTGSTGRTQFQADATMKGKQTADFQKCKQTIDFFQIHRCHFVICGSRGVQEERES